MKPCYSIGKRSATLRVGGVRVRIVRVGSSWHRYVDGPTEGIGIVVLSGDADEQAIRVVLRRLMRERLVDARLDAATLRAHHAKLVSETLAAARRMSEARDFADEIEKAVRVLDNAPDAC